MHLLWFRPSACSIASRWFLPWPGPEGEGPRGAPPLLSSELPREHETSMLPSSPNPHGRLARRPGNPFDPSSRRSRSFESRAALDLSILRRRCRVRRCVPTPTQLRGLLDVDRSTQRLSSSLRGPAGCGDIRRTSVITLLDRRTLSSEQPREGLPAPRARGAIHRVAKPDFRLGWWGFRPFEGSRAAGALIERRRPPTWGCLLNLSVPAIRTR
jgi:hypothetical protein